MFLYGAYTAIGTIYLGDLEFNDNPITDPSVLDCSDPDAACTAYRYAPVTEALGSFPTVWQPASILSGDNNAQAKWESIRAGVPDIPPKVWTLLKIHPVY